MPVDFITIVRSVRRSRIRRGILLSLARRKFAYAQLIADDAETEPWMVRAAVRGRRPYFSPTLSLRRLGLVVHARANGRPCFVITPLGIRVARRLARIVL